MASTGFMEDAKNVLFKGFELFGTPDAYLRGLMAGSPGEKIWSGRDLLERTGWVGPERGGLDFGDIAGFAIDVMNPLSPTNLLFGWTKALGKGAMAGAKGLGGISKAAAAGKGAEALAQAKSLLGAAGGAAKAIAPGYAMAMGLPYAGAKLMAHGDERAPWKDALGMGLMTLPFALPLGMAAMRKGGFKKWSKKNVQEEIARLDAESGVPPQVPKEPWQMSPEEFLATFGVHATDSAASFKPEPRLLEVTRPGQKRFFQGDAVVVRDALGRPIEGQGYNAALPGERASVVSSDPKVVSLYEQGHEALVRDAMARGLSIPDEVVSRYPQLQQARAALQPARRELDFLEQMGIRAADEQQQVIQAARAQGIADLASDAGAQFVSGVAPPANPLSMRPGMTPQQELMERARAALGVANQGRSSGPSLMSLTPAAAGGTMLAMNENDDPTMNAIGTALLLGGLGLPLAMTAAKAGGKAGKGLEQAKQALLPEAEAVLKSNPPKAWMPDELLGPQSTPEGGKALTEAMNRMRYKLGSGGRVKGQAAAKRDFIALHKKIEDPNLPLPERQQAAMEVMSKYGLETYLRDQLLRAENPFLAEYPIRNLASQFGYDIPESIAQWLRGTQ